MPQIAILPKQRYTVETTDTLCQPIDVEAHRKNIPQDSMVKGHFANALIDYVTAHNPAMKDEYKRLYPRPFASFQDVSLRETLQQGVDAARLAHPDLPLAEALRQLGRFAYQSMLRSLIGRVIFGALGPKPSLVYRYGPRSHEVFEKNGTHITYTPISERSFEYRYDPCYNWLSSYMVGVVEGVALSFGYQTRLQIELEDPYRGVFRCSW